MYETQSPGAFFFNATGGWVILKGTAVRRWVRRPIDPCGDIPLFLTPSRKDEFMWTRRWMLFITGILTDPIFRGITLTLYYLLIILGLILLYGKGDFSTPEFIYQGF